MGRPLRIEIPNGTYHLTSRGSDRRDIFTAGGDRAFFLKLLGIVTFKYAWTVLAYCLMTNHYHLVLRIADGGLSKGMQWLNGVFSRATNYEQGREAHLFRNRFNARLISSEAHLVAACRYVVLNPVAAGLCDQPEDWEWSSYRATAGLVDRPAFLADGELLRFFASSTNEARRRYVEFVAEGVAELRAAKDPLVPPRRNSVSDTGLEVRP